MCTPWRGDVIERAGVRRAVPAHVDRDAHQRTRCRSAAEEETPDDNERQEAGKRHGFVHRKLNDLAVWVNR